MENKQKALEMAAAMQQKEKSGSLLWCVAEDLKNTINGMNEDEARVVITDFEAGTHDLKTCEKAIHDYANKHKSGSSACCPGPAVPGILRVRFGLLFDQLQDAAGKIFDLVDTLQQGGLTEKAEKFQVALHKALLALADEAERGE